MRNPTRTSVPSKHAVPDRVLANITYSLVSGTGGGTRLSSVRTPVSALRTQRNAFYRISGRVEAAAPAQVVVPASGWYTATSPQGDPVSLLGLGHPRPLDTALLVQGDEIAHPNRVGDASMVGQP